jgi:transposase-like protein
MEEDDFSSHQWVKKMKEIRCNRCNSINIDSIGIIGDSRYNHLYQCLDCDKVFTNTIMSEHQVSNGYRYLVKQMKEIGVRIRLREDKKA